jgi:hypothetical protein
VVRRRRLVGPGNLGSHDECAGPRFGDCARLPLILAELLSCAPGSAGPLGMRPASQSASANDCRGGPLTSAAIGTTVDGRSGVAPLW